MPRKLNYTLTTEELQQIENAIKNHEDARVRTRAQMIHMLHLGHDTTTVAKILVTTRATVYFWNSRWREQGIEGLLEKSRRGRPPIGGDVFKQKLEALVAKEPSEFDYGFSVWTVERLIEHMGIETGHYVSVGTMHKRLEDLNFVYRRPKHDLGNLQDKDAKKQAEIAIDALKKKAESGEIELFFVDETTIKLLCTLIKCWMKRGQQKRIPTPGQNKWQHVIGALNWRTNEVIYQVIDKKNTKSFCEFLEYLMKQAETERPIVYVLDNASYHHSKVSEAMIAYLENKAIPMWLPVYCSDLNPIERYWKHLKDNACANRLFKDVQEVVDSVVNVLNEQNNLASTKRLVFQNNC